MIASILLVVVLSRTLSMPMCMMNCTALHLVSEDQSLHRDADPRYRGSHIPSRAFRILQNFTDSTSDVTDHGMDGLSNL